tara:strand:+ start:2166 stop:2702 length:537 start_codon:yes stop_codon:yes gene_type:complete
MTVRFKNERGDSAATLDDLKGFRKMVRVVFDDVVATEAEGGNSVVFESLPPGTHEVTVKRCEEKVSGNNNDGLNMLLEDHEGRSVWDTVWITPKSMPNVLRFAKAIGCEPQSGVALTLTPEAVTGRRAFISVVEEEYDGKLRARIEFMSWQPPAVPNISWSETAAPVIDPVQDIEIPF